LNTTKNCTVSRINATTFDLNIDTSANTTNEGTWTTDTAPNFASWRAATAAIEVSLACEVPFLTCTADTLSFPDKMALMAVEFQGQSDYDLHPGRMHNYYHSPGIWSGITLSLYPSITAWRAGNLWNSSTGNLMESEATYTTYGANTHHRGSGWVTESDQVYPRYWVGILSYAKKRGVVGVGTTQIDKVINAAGIEASLLEHPGHYIIEP
jgi:hypothetical protein